MTKAYISCSISAKTVRQIGRAFADFSNQRYVSKIMGPCRTKSVLARLYSKAADCSPNKTTTTLSLSLFLIITEISCSITQKAENLIYVFHKKRFQ